MIPLRYFASPFPGSRLDPVQHALVADPVFEIVVEGPFEQLVNIRHARPYRFALWRRQAAAPLSSPAARALHSARPMKTPEAAMTNAGPIGRPVPRKEDARLLRGRARFVDDVRLGRMLHGVFLRSPHPHAEIGMIDTSAALAAGGRLVLTADDLPFADRAFVVRYWHEAIRGGTQPFLARGRVRYVGEPVALVVADDPYRAEDLAGLVEIAYRPLDPVAGIEAAMAEGAPGLHDSWTQNVAARFSYERGDAGGALDRAARRVTHESRFARQIPLPLETRGAVADFDRSRGALTVRLSTQAHYNVRENLASLLDLPESAVRVICEDVGGGFGAKSRCYGEEIVLAEASRVLDRPVKWIEDRRENMLATTHSRGIDVTLELGLSEDGRFEALRATVALDTGAYVFTSGIATGELCGALIPGAYRIPDFSVEVLAVGTNKTPAATYRGAGQPEAALAIETLVDRAARAVGLDAAEIRRRNLVRPGDLPHATGTGFGGIAFEFLGGDFPALLDRVTDASGYDEAVETRSDGTRLAWGLAGGVDVSGVVNFESARVGIDPSGDVIVHSGMSSQGQGQATTFAQIAADALGADVDRVSVAMGDTALLAFGRGAFASRGAIMGGSAVLEAAGALRARTLEAAAHSPGRSRRARVGVGRSVSGGTAAEPGSRWAGWRARSRPAGRCCDGGSGLEAETVLARRPARDARLFGPCGAGGGRPGNRFGRGRGLYDRPRYRARAQSRDRQRPGRGRRGGGDRERAACRDDLRARRSAAHIDPRRLFRRHRRRRARSAPDRTGHPIAHQPARYSGRRRKRFHRAARGDLERRRPGHGVGRRARPDPDFPRRAGRGGHSIACPFRSGARPSPKPSFDNPPTRATQDEEGLCGPGNPHPEQARSAVSRDATPQRRFRCR